MCPVIESSEALLRSRDAQHARELVLGGRLPPVTLTVFASDIEMPCRLTLQHVSALSRAYSTDVATYETRVSPRLVPASC